MGISFSKARGKAQSNKVDSYVMKDGDNVLRMFGNVLPRYVYWVKGPNGKDVAFECLGFDRDLEKFTNIERDHVREFFPDLKCGWAYSIQAIDVKEGVVKTFNLKKKLYEAISTAAEDLGDPTDPDNGFDIHFKKVKTGPLAFNVEYQLQVLRCKNRPLTEAERALVASAKSIDEVYPRPTADEQLAALEKLAAGAEATSEDAGAAEAAADL